MTIARARNGAGPDIVRDGLIFYLDSANERCDPDRVSGGSNGNDLTNGSSVRGINSTEQLFINGVSRDKDQLNLSPKHTRVFDFLPGSSGYIGWAEANDHSPTQMTLLTWLFPRNIRPEEIIARNGSDSPGGDGWRFFTAEYASNSGTIWGFRPNTSAGEVTSSVALNEDEWQHLAVTYTTNDIEFYYNGSLQATEAATGAIDHTGNEIRIGDGTGGAQRHFDGQLAIFMMYNRVLSSDEVSQNYNAHKGRFGL